MIPVRCSLCGTRETHAVHPSHFSEPLNEHDGCGGRWVAVTLCSHSEPSHDGTTYRCDREATDENLCLAHAVSAAFRLAKEEAAEMGRNLDEAARVHVTAYVEARSAFRAVAIALVYPLVLVVGFYVAWWSGAFQTPLSPDEPLPGRVYVLPCTYGPVSRVCVFDRVSEARYSETSP
jgi:hypothetical protein